MKSSSLAAPKSHEGGSAIRSHSAFDVRCSMFDVRRSVFLKPLLVLIFFTLPSAFGQGSLTPPGPPAATMLTLSQVEPRTPISSAPYVITQPGSYYLTTNITVSGGNAITIATNGVTLDLSGFTISSTAATAAGYGIDIGGDSSGLRNITIANGFIQGGVTNNGNGVYGGSGFDYGIYYSVSPPVNMLVSRVSVSSCLVVGIYLGESDSTVVESCTARTIGDYGILAGTITQSSAADCGSDAILGDQVCNCLGETTTGANGVTALTAQNCYGASFGAGDGVSAQTGLNCYGYNASGDGISASVAENCFGYSNAGGYGLYAIYTASGCYGFSFSGTGLDAFIANVCHGATSSGTALSTTHNVNSY